MKLFLFGGTGSNSKDKESLTPPFQTLAADTKFLEIISKKTPKILLLPTAQEGFDFVNITIERFKRQYGDYLNCQTDVLFLADNPKIEDIQQKLDWADAYIIPGGDPNHLLQIWKSIDFIQAFFSELAKDKPVMGISAGAMCFFDGVLSTEDETAQILKTGIGLIEGVCMPHFNREKLKGLREKLLSQAEYDVYAIDDNAALYIVNNQAEIWSAVPGANAYIYKKEAKKILQCL